MTSKTVLHTRDLPGVMGYKLATSLVVPRPIGWIGTMGANGVPNLAPYSFYNAVSGMPPTVVFSPAASGRRDTLDNVKASGEFTVNVVTADVAEAMNQSAASVSADEDEFALANVTAVASTVVGAPMVGECLANFECIVTQIVPVGHPEHGNQLVIGEVVVFHIANSIFDGDYIDQAALGAIGRHAGNTYSRANDQFELERPT